MRADWDAQKLVDAEARRLASTARERRYDARQKQTDKEARDGQEKIAALETDLAGTRAAGDRLRAAIRTAGSGARPAAGPAGAGEGEPGPDPVGLFAHLLERADARAERVSGFADRLRIAGETCEQYADGIQPSDQ